MKQFSRLACWQGRFEITLPSATIHPLPAAHPPPAPRPPAIIDLGLPADVAGLRVECHHESVGRCEIDHILVDGDALASRPDTGNARGVVAAIFPDQVTVGRVDRLDAG